MLDGLKALSEHQHDKQDAKEKRLNAIMAVRAAALDTKAYLYDHDVAGDEDRNREIALSQRRNDAATAIANYDAHLFAIAQMKSRGWADPREWNDLPIDPDKLKLDLILQQCDFLLTHGA